MLLNVESAGPTSGPAVVLLHGLTGFAGDWGEVAAVLAGAGHRVLAMDLRGHGFSPRADSYRALEYAADVAETIAALAGGPARVVGHSLGGLTASALAVHHPEVVAAVLLEDPPTYEGDDERRNASPIAARFPEFVALVESLQARSAPVDEVADLLGAAPSPFGGTSVERFGTAAMRVRAAAVLQCHPETIRAAIDGSTWHGFDPDAPLPVPTTVVRGEQRYGSVLPEDLAAQFVAVNPDAEVVAVPGVGHSIHADPNGREAFLAVLARFVAA